MGVRIRAAAATLVLVTVSLWAFVLISPNAAAATRTWTTDTDFNQPGAVFASTEVVGTGVPAHVDLIRSTTDWANKNPSGPTPGALESPAMAFDASGGVTVLFGGYNGLAPNLYIDQTWEFNWAADTWTDTSSSPRPPLRQSGAMSYDPVEGVMVLFGGFNDTVFLTDTWEYDVATNTWSEITTSPSPQMMATYTMVYHASASRHVMVGSDFSQNVVVWAYDAAANTWANRSPSGTPSARSGFATAYHAVRQRTVLFGGALFQTLYSNTYEYNYVANTRTMTTSSGPSARASHAMAYRESSGSIILFGGVSGAGTLQDTWQYHNNPGPIWDSVSTFNSPPARKYHALAGDSADDVVILYGGRSAGGSLLGDTWSLGASYAAAGKYRSDVFDSGGAGVNWDRLWWNKTPANQPANTFLRFQLAAVNNPADQFDFAGPDGNFFSYYTSVGTAIWSGLDGRRYLKFLGDFGSTNPQNTPAMEDVTITYDIPPAPPCIVYTDPADLTFNVPQNYPVTIGFSEAMNKTSLNITFTLGTPVTLTRSWSFNDSVVTLTHAQPFAENKVYRLTIAATDLDGLPLSATCPGGSPAAPNPFTFVTEKIYPFITKTTPPDQYAFPYGTTTPIYVEFSEGMKTTSLVVTATPNANFNAVWSNGDTNVSLTPSPALLPCSVYVIQIDAMDKANNPLVPGPVNNPWTFYTDCANPYITATNPIDLQLDVALNSPIIIDFAEPMLTTSVVVTIMPGITVTPTWSNGNRRLTLTHTAAFPRCTVYKVTVTGTDPQGNPLIPNPVNPNIENPFRFMTLCDNPSIFLTVPEDGAVNVSVSQQIMVAFTDAMNEASVSFIVNPAVGQIAISWDASVIFHINHAPFTQCTHYTVTIPGGTSQSGFPLVAGFAPNPWSFDTICESPYVTDTNPPDGAFLVPLDFSIWVNFSEPMDTSNFGYISAPDPGYTLTWLNGDRTLRFDHATPFVDCTPYTIFVDGQDLAGNGLLTGAASPGAPDPWSFTTFCVVPFPYITNTDPAHMQQNVPLTKSIVVDFSEAIDRTSFRVTIGPNIALTAIWSNGDTRVTLAHTTDFPDCTNHVVTISAQDLSGNSLGNVTGSKPNPWSFKTLCIPPQILSTDPANNATGVSLDKAIVVTFSDPMNRLSVQWIIAPNIGLTPAWSAGDTIVTLSHATAFQPLTTYCVQISGQNVQGSSLVAGPVPNPWCFTTGSGLPAPQGLQVIRQSPNIVLRWQAVPGAAGYRIYSSTNRFSTFPTGWSLLRDQPETNYTASGHYIDGLNRYYLVRARDSSNGLSPNSTMGAKIPLAFSFATTRSNAYWLSLPFRSMYAKASDISDELTSASVDVVAKWNAATQNSILWYFSRGGWRGVNFAIGPGDALWIGARRPFAWVINGTDRDISLSFTVFPQPNANLNWIGLPYTSAYRTAGDIVRAIEGGTGPGRNTKIIEVAKWDGLTQQYVKYLYGPTGWSGTDFAIASGEAIYLKVVADFSWTPALLTPEVP